MATPALAPNRKIGGYVLLEQLGAGGIGEVWKARDPKLNRVVALKFLSLTRPGSAPERDLLAEARAASALNHPNIVTIFEVNEREGGTYLAMEFVEGETLRARLRHGPLPSADAAQIATQVASALAVAHQHGIIHRDLKPENIMLRLDGYVKLLDFGLAKKLPWASDDSTAIDSATRTGQVVGTFQYMSPEQARGQSVTPASDVFSLGIVIYEMLTGAHPFDSGSVADTLTAILTKEPTKVAVRCPSAPPNMVSTIERALAKTPEARFPSAVEMTESLREQTAAVAAASAPAKSKTWLYAVAAGVVLLIAVVMGVMFFRGGGSAGGAQVRSVAVLNLRASADDAASTALSESLAEDLGVALSRAGLEVASHSAARGVTGDARTIGSQLGVDSVLDGSIRASGNNIKVHLELVSTRTGFQVWSGNFLFDSQELVSGNEQAAARIATELATALAARSSGK